MKNNEYITTYCTGCGLCHSVLGKKLTTDERGFPYAVIDDNEDCTFYEGVCPVFYYRQNNMNNIWGKVDWAVIGYSANNMIRYRAASGGALTALCLYLLEQKLVDGVCHTMPDEKDCTKNVSCVSKSEDEIIRRCGSRYSISVPLMDILQETQDGKRYAFVGKPCDVMALRRYIDLHAEMKERFPYLLSFFCAGEPSVKAQERLLSQMGSSREDCKKLVYRGNGWPGYTTVTKQDGTSAKLEYKIVWGKYLGRDLRNYCRFCMDGTGDAADIVCADFWYLDENEKPDFSEHDGRNIIFSRSPKGTQIVQDALVKGYIKIEKDYTDSMEEFYKYQPAQCVRKGTMKSFIYAMRLCKKETPDYSKSILNRYAQNVFLKTKIKYFCGTIKRIILGKII